MQVFDKYFLKEFHNFLQNGLVLKGLYIFFRQGRLEQMLHHYHFFLKQLG